MRTRKHGSDVAVMSRPITQPVTHPGAMTTEGTELSSSTAPLLGPPEDLRSFLSAGGSATSLDGWTFMAEAVKNRRAEGERSQLFFEELLGTLADQSCASGSSSLKGRDSYIAAASLRCRRIIELLTDEELAVEFEQAIRAEDVRPSSSRRRFNRRRMSRPGGMMRAAAS